MYYFGLFIKKTLRLLLKPLSFVPAIVMMYVIFNFSAQDGTTSAALSLKVTQKIVYEMDTVLDMGWSSDEEAAHVEQLHYYVRKMGHVTEYFILAVTVAVPLYVYGVRGIWLILLAGTLCVGYAGLDEYHQSFTMGRGPSVKDVGIDSIGVFAGVILSEIFCFIGGATIFRPLRLQPRKGV